jgi:2-aminoadipate transaminase
MDYSKLLADRTKNMSGSAIREILKVIRQPGMVSLAGGIPAPESFPMDVLKELEQIVMEKYKTKAFQYDLTEGFGPFRESLVSFVKRKGIDAKADDIFVTSGSQGALDSIAKILLNKGDKVVVESPTYLGAMTSFNPYEPEYVEIDSDEEGLVPESLEKVLTENEVKFVYLVPTFQNPTGKTIGDERRKKIAEIIKKHEMLVIEDDPYSELRYRGESVNSLYSYAPENVIYAGTLSKVFAPGLRLGFFVAPDKELAQWLTIAKQGTDLHTNSFAQALAAEYLSGGYFDKHLPNIINLYKPKQETMLEALGEFFPDSFKFTKPEGGMFIWIEGPETIDGEEIYWKAIEEKVAFVPGKYFYANHEHGRSTMRLNFTSTDEATIREAVRKLGKVLEQFTK